MAAPFSGTTSSITWSISKLQVGNVTIPSARLEVEIFLPTLLPGLQIIAEQAWLDTGAPLSVIPFHVHNQRIAWKPIPGMQVSWAGQPCDVGTVDLWLPTDQPPSPRGPFTILAKFPHNNPPGKPVPVLLGLEFFLALQAGMSLLPPPQQSVIQLP
jgi:hypothetical protein